MLGDFSMKPYGNEHSWVIDALNSTKNYPMSSKKRRSVRRVYKASRRAKDKIALRNRTDD
jgi:hypothetical protein